MAIETILNLLSGCEERSYGEWVAHCPACGGVRRLLVRADGDGHVSMHCMRHCALGHILWSLGLTWHALKPDRRPDRPTYRRARVEPNWWRGKRRYPVGER